MALFLSLLLIPTIFVLQQEMQLIPAIKYISTVQCFTKEKDIYQLCVEYCDYKKE